MHVEGTAALATRRRRTRRSTAAVIAQLNTVTPAPAGGASVPTRQLPTGPATTQRTVPIGDISKAAGPWDVDWPRAHHDAQLVLDSIDYSKRDIVIWVPGTSNHGVHTAFEAAVRDSYRGEGASLSALEYEASWNLRRSLPTGVATMKLVLEGIQQRLAQQGGAPGVHRVLLSGESQGAWIIGEAMADPAYGTIVDRAILVGHPWLAKHQYDAGQDPRVRVINHQGDMVAVKVNGDPTEGLDAMVAIRTLGLTKVGLVLKALANNPGQGVALLKSLTNLIPFVKTVLRDPHNYSGEMTRAVEYLREGTLPMSQTLTAALADSRAGAERAARLADAAAAPAAPTPSPDELDARRLDLERQLAVAAYRATASAAA